MTDDKLSRVLYDLNDRVYKMERRLSTLKHESFLRYQSRGMDQ